MSEATTIPRPSTFSSCPFGGSVSRAQHRSLFRLRPSLWDFITAIACFGGLGASLVPCASGEEPDPASALVNRRRDVEGQLNAANENLFAIAQQLQDSTPLSATDKKRLEGEQAKLRVRVASLTKQMEQLNQRLPDDTRIKVFQLRNMKAIEAERIIRTLLGQQLQSIAADERTNSLIASGQEVNLTVVYALLTRLDEQVADKNAPLIAADARGTAKTAASIADFTKKYEAQEQEAAKLASEIRGAPDDLSHKATRTQLQAKLRQAVKESFAARQQLHRAEADELTARVQSIKANLERRDKIADQIVEQRVNDLLNPDLQWEQRNHLAPRAESVSPSEAVDFIAARAYRDKLRERWAQIENLYLNGRFQIGELLQAAKELGEAEVAAAATPAERLAARQQHLERLHGVKSVFDAKFAAEVEPENQKLAVDAEVLKAEAALASESSHPQASPAQLAAIPSSQQDQLTDQETEKIWSVLGVRVRTAKKEELIGDRYGGGAVITEVRPGSPADGPAPLRVGDVIVMAGQREVTSPKRLAFILTQPFATETSTDGETKLIGLIEVQRGRGIVQNGMQFPLGALPSYRPGTADPAAAPADGKTATLRTPSQFQQSLTTAEERFNRLKRDDVSRFAGSSAEEKTQLKEKMVRDAEQRLRLAQAEYAAQIRLLQLELQDATSAVSAAEQQSKLAKEMHKVRPDRNEQVISSERTLQDAQLREERAKTLLDLYQQVDPKQSNQVNPVDGTATPVDPFGRPI